MKIVSTVFDQGKSCAIDALESTRDSQILPIVNRPTKECDL